MSQHRPIAVALWPGVLLCTVAAVMAFTLSFTALRAVGIASGITPRLAWMFPLTDRHRHPLRHLGCVPVPSPGGRRHLVRVGPPHRVRRRLWSGNFLHAQPVRVGSMELPRPVASLFSSVPSLSLLLTTHMLVLIAVRRGEKRDQDRVVAVGVATPTKGQTTPIAAGAQIAGAGVDDLATGALVASIAPSDAEDDECAAGRVDSFAAWVTPQKCAGVRPTGRMVVEAGFVGSEATGRRWLRDMREQTALRAETEA